MFKTEPCKSCLGTGKQLDQKYASEMLRRRRERSGRSLRSVAAAMGITGPYLSDLEHARRRWRQELIEKFNKAVNL
jgi:transcriptional regulator with XRE-family HTH domain